MSSAFDDTLPMHCGDFRKDTRHLSAEEKGAYMELLIEYYIHKKALKNDKKTLKNVSGVSFKKCEKILQEFFFFDRGFWFHKRVELEIAKWQAVKAGRSNGAYKTNKKRWKYVGSNTVTERLTERLTERVACGVAHRIASPPLPLKQAASLSNTINTPLPPKNSELSTSYPHIAVDNSGISDYFEGVTEENLKDINFLLAACLGLLKKYNPTITHLKNEDDSYVILWGNVYNMRDVLTVIYDKAPKATTPPKGLVYFQEAVIEWCIPREDFDSKSLTELKARIEKYQGMRKRKKIRDGFKKIPKSAEYA